jgi:hypothetical protein
MKFSNTFDLRQVEAQERDAASFVPRAAVAARRGLI